MPVRVSLGLSFESLVVVVKNDLTAAIFKPEGHVKQIPESLSDFVLIFGARKKQYKTASSGPKQLTADRAGIPGGFIDRIYLRGGDLIRQAAFELPGFM